MDKQMYKELVADLMRKESKLKERLDNIITMSGEYNWHSDISMRFALDKIKNELTKLRGEL